MNGDVNGTMEEPVQSPLPTSPIDKETHQKVTPDDCDDLVNDCENSNNSGCSNHVDSESNNCSMDNIISQNTAHDDDKDVSSENSFITVSQDDSKQEHGTDTIENNCGNSNESYQERIQSCPEKSDILIEIPIKVSNENENCIKNSEKLGNPEETAQNSNNDADSQDSFDDDESVMSQEHHKAEDTVSINSDSDEESGDETSQGSQLECKNSDVIILDTGKHSNSQNGNSNSHEVHEIESDNDDCVVENQEEVEKPHAEKSHLEKPHVEEPDVEKPNVEKPHVEKKHGEKQPVDKSSVDEKTPLRRSSRAIKRKRYMDDIENGDVSDIEQIEFQDNSHRRSRPIVINDTKALVEMAAKQMRHGSNQKGKEPTVVIIDTNSVPTSKGTSLLLSKNTNSSSNSALSAQSLYQSIVARGTTVTPVINKNTTSTQASQNTQLPILPSLTDDMFVVEVPSFIVPYVYEKPPIKPFREFVFKLGKELDEQKLKNEGKDQESKDQNVEDKGEAKNAEHSGDEGKSTKNNADSEEAVTKTKKSSKKDRRRNDDDDASWDGESASESDEALSDEEDKIVVKDKTEPIDQIKNVTELTADKICSTKTSSSMDCSLGKFFINIGLNLVQEYVQTDLLKQQNRKLYKEKKKGENTKATESSIMQLMKNLEFSKENNAPYAHKQKKCEHCSFKSESTLVMAHHLETPHMKNGLYKCNYCAFEIRSPHDILYHMEAEHNVRGKLERAPAYHQCANCPFEDNGKGKLARHIVACAKKFKPDTNLAPPVDWEPPAKIPKIAKPRNSIVGGYHNTFNRVQMGNNISRAPMNIGGMTQSAAAGYRPRARLPWQGIPIVRPGTAAKNTSPTLMHSNFPNVKAKSTVHQPSISITPLPRLPPPQAQQTPGSQNKSSFVICEICDGYIKDLEQLRNHMQWIHKVKIHPKMIYNRPPLNCQKCQFRFFTDQGLERHLLGSHGLVTSSMQEAANKGKDAGRCPVCGRVYQWKLLNHVARDHNLTLKPAHLSYKCTVCTATFGMYKQFENHVYSAHSVVAKRVMDKSKGAAPAAKSAEHRAKPLKINDEITIIPQSVKTTSTKTEK